MQPKSDNFNLKSNNKRNYGTEQNLYRRALEQGNQRDELRADEHHPLPGRRVFPAGPTERTKHIWNLCLKALEEERANNGVRSLDNATVSTITSHKAGYIDREQELIVGLQTDELLKRAIKPFGGINVVSRACKENGVDVDEKVRDISPIPQDA